MTRQSPQDRNAIQRVGTDMQLEEGVLEIGSLVHVTTVQFAYRGILEAVTPSFYVLSDAWNVFETGPLGNYFETQKGSNEERWPGRCLVERTATTATWSFR